MLTEHGPRADGDYVLYWMTAARRPFANFALQRAVSWANELSLPLVVFEPLRLTYPWASERLHRFVIDGMLDNARYFDAYPSAHYMPYLERVPGEGKGLLERLSSAAAVLVGDDYPCFFLPRMVDTAARRATVRFEVVDSNGLYPMRATSRAFTTAHSFRRHLQKTLPPEMVRMPTHEPVRALRPGLGSATLPTCVTGGAFDFSAASLDDAVLSKLALDRQVGAVSTKGGHRAAQQRLAAFVAHDLDRYGTQRSHPDEDAASGLSPYLHFGHLSAHEAFMAVASREPWSPLSLNENAAGARHGFWGMSSSAESFLDELVTWRELGFNACVHLEAYDRFESLPDWAKTTLAQHEQDPRPYLYDIETLANARTHDEIWNAAQRELRVEGRVQNYLRMLWGKQILAWSPSPARALEVMIELNNRYALDGRDPNSYAGIFWVLGRYDRAWGPERPIFGKVRYMTSDSTRRKLRLKRYLQRYGAQSSLL